MSILYNQGSTGSDFRPDHSLRQRRGLPQLLDGRLVVVGGHDGQPDDELASTGSTCLLKSQQELAMLGCGYGSIVEWRVPHILTKSSFHLASHCES